MESMKREKFVLFDLDNTLFDHHHALASAISVAQKKYTDLAGHKPENLMVIYNTALQKAYDKYLRKEITRDETNILKVQLFFTNLGLPKPSTENVKELIAIYEPAYRENRRATPGSVETLVRLRENGYRLAILSNGQIKDQAAKAEAIGVLHLVDHVFTSEEVGYTKPEPRIFQCALPRCIRGFSKYNVHGRRFCRDGHQGCLGCRIERRFIFTYSS